MGEVTVLELNLEGASFTLHLPFSGPVRKTIGESEEPDEVDVSEEVEREEGSETAADDGGGKGKGLAVVGVFVFLVAAVALAKYLMGDGEEEAVPAEEDRAVGVTVGDEDD